jgi:hypothetical protein
MAKRAYRHRPQFRHQFRHLPQFRRMPQFRMVAMTRWLNRTVRPPVAPTIPFLSNIATDYLQARNLVDKVAAPLPVPPELVKAIPDLVHVILDPLIGKDAPKAREEPLGVVKQLVHGKTLRAEDADETGVDDASEDSSSQTETSTTTAAGPQDTSVVAPNRPAGCPSKRSQPPPPSGSGGDEGVSAGGDVSCSG